MTLTDFKPMKALSLTQPWASLVALKEKHWETRSWQTPYRGDLAIHASKAYPRWAKEAAREEPLYSSLCVGKNYCYPEIYLGSVICIVRLVECRRTEDVRWKLDKAERAFGDYGDGRYAWRLEFVDLVIPHVPAVGHLGLWDWTPPNA